MRPPEDDILLRDILDHARKAVAAAKGRTRADLDRDEILAGALERFVEGVGEAASKVSDATQRETVPVPWRGTVGMRNRLVHGDASVDHDVVQDVATTDLAALVTELENALRAAT